MVVQERRGAVRWQAPVGQTVAWTVHAATLLFDIGLVLLIGYLGMRMRALIP